MHIPFFSQNPVCHDVSKIAFETSLSCSYPEGSRKQWDNFPRRNQYFLFIFILTYIISVMCTYDFIVHMYFYRFQSEFFNIWSRPENARIKQLIFFMTLNFATCVAKQHCKKYICNLGLIKIEGKLISIFVAICSIYVKTEVWN